MEHTDSSFIKKIGTAALLCLGILLFAGIFIYTFNIWLLLMAGVILAVFLRLIADKLKDWYGWKDIICFLLSILITLSLLVGLFYSIGNKVQEQYHQLEAQWPAMKSKAAAYVENNPKLEELAGNILGEKKVDNITNMISSEEEDASAEKGMETEKTPAPTPSKPIAGNLGSTLSSFFTSTFGLLGDLYVVMFLGLFLAATPLDYRDGIVQLMPPSARQKTKQVLNKTGENLTKWFKGMTYSMLVTFVLSAVGLLLLDQDLWLILAIIAGLMTFIPNFGPLIALVPATLVGLTDSPQTALYIIILYMSIQLVESNLITPLIQKKMIKTPPALLLFFQMLMGALSSGWGVVMATPVLVVIISFVQELYVKSLEKRNPGGQNLPE